MMESSMASCYLHLMKQSEWNRDCHSFNFKYFFSNFHIIILPECTRPLGTITSLRHIVEHIPSLSICVYLLSF